MNEDVYYEDDYRLVEAHEIEAITLGSIVEGFDGEGPSFKISRNDGTLTYENFHKVLEMIDKECSNLWNQANHDWALETKRISQEDRDLYESSYETFFTYEPEDYIRATHEKKITNPQLINQEVYKIFNFSSVYDPEWIKNDQKLSLYSLGRTTYKYNDCGPWLNFTIKNYE